MGADFDSMYGGGADWTELVANIIAGRVANVFDLHGPNYTVDAACASSMAAMEAAMHGLVQGDIDAALTGGIDRNMGVNAFVKFCKIGALSATGTRPYADGADGFVMGEGAAVFLLKRLADAERDGVDRIGEQRARREQLVRLSSHQRQRAAVSTDICRQSS